jgi:hypothetical protein
LIYKDISKREKALLSADGFFPMLMHGLAWIFDNTTEGEGERALEEVVLYSVAYEESVTSSCFLKVAYGKVLWRMQARNSRGMKLVIAELYYAMPCRGTSRKHPVNIDLRWAGFSST